MVSIYIVFSIPVGLRKCYCAGLLFLNVPKVSDDH